MKIYKFQAKTKNTKAIRRADMIGRWYKRVLKTWAKRAYELDHDREMKAFIALRRKRARMAKREQMAKAGVAR